MRSYCIKEKKQTECTPGSERYERTRNGRLMLKCVCESCGITKTKFVSSTEGGAIDIHKAIGRLPKPKGGWTPGKYKYMGPYNPLDQQLEYDPTTGKVTKWNVQPYKKVDEIAAYHDICYDMEKDKGDCDRRLVKSLDAIPYGEMPKWGQTARFLIDKKQKLGLGVKKSKNGRGR